MMVRGLFFLAALLVLAGASAIVNGAGMILNERGWSQVIAGSMIMTGGFVVLALTAVLREIQQGMARIETKIHAAPPQALAPEGEASSGFYPHAPAVMQTPPPVLSTALSTAAETPAFNAADQTLPSASLPVAETVRPEQAETAALVPASPEIIVAPPASDYEQISPLPDSVPLQHTPAFAPEPTTPPAETAVARPQLKQPTLFELVQEQAAGQPQPLHRPPANPVMPSRVVMPDMAPPAATIPPAAIIPAAERILLASYSTGGVGYFMYSDQSIEAEMAIGRYRFNSMDELRRFIETQEGGVKVSG